ncbi:hypothetical protein L798_09902 [Zootermopsis nevadensis]|uniref:Uncharacterized protein n=1 Tax=Zootermopsis nevadensis TaxID=136037 RepID=A0A067R3C0_ZOONE|nr:hypothetical protein L798_09902 [Zootermopsis nevadensis]
MNSILGLPYQLVTVEQSYWQQVGVWETAWLQFQDMSDMTTAGDGVMFLCQYCLLSHQLAV